MSKSYSPKRLYMDLRSGSGFAKANLNLHKDVDHVIVRKSPSYNTENNPVAEAEDCVITLEAVAALENLTKLDLVDFDGGNLPVQGLAVVFRNAKKLNSLRIDSVRMSGTRQEFAQFVKELKGHPSLSEIHLVGCLPSRETEMIQCMAEALASLGTLRVVEIVETRFSPYDSWSGNALADICKSPTLKILRVRGVRFLRDDHIILMAKALQNHNSLEELSLLCDIGERAVEAICEMLRENQSLQVVCLNRIMEGKQSADIARALALNTTVRELHLYFRYCVLEHLRSAFLELMEKNYTLEKLAGGWVCSNLNLYLKLNKAGRKQLLGSDAKPSASDWIDLMASQQEDVASVYYLLSQNPTLCYESY